MEHKGVEVAFVVDNRGPQSFPSANWWGIKNGFLSVIERTEFKVVTKEKVRRRIVETVSYESEDVIIAHFPIDGVFHVKYMDLGERNE